MPMTVDAPRHLQGLLLPDERHAIDLTMAGRASDALVHVDAVIEVREVRKVVHARPRDRTSASEARTNRFQERARRENLRMAIHAGLRGRNARERRFLD
jgi:hypothetical protein